MAINVSCDPQRKQRLSKCIRLVIFYLKVKCNVEGTLKSECFLSMEKHGLIHGKDLSAVVNTSNISAENR